MRIADQSVKAAADVATGTTVANATDSNSLIVTIVTILARLGLEFLMHEREKRRRRREEREQKEKEVSRIKSPPED